MKLQTVLFEVVIEGQVSTKSSHTPRRLEE